MNCTESQSLIGALIDNELGPEEQARLHRHLENCPRCRLAHQHLSRLQASVHRGATTFIAPSHLSRRITDALVTSRPPRASRARLAALPWSWINLGAATAFASALAFVLALRVVAPAPAESIEQQIVASHYRSLMVDHLTDVASSDRHTVKPWLATRLDFAPSVIDLAGEGYALTGGRLDYLDGRPVAALVYRIRQHVINVFVWPDRGHPRLPAHSERNGFELVSWTAGGLRYCAISDMNAGDLQQFADTLEPQIAAPPHS